MAFWVLHSRGPGTLAVALASSVLAASVPACAQTALPEITVTAPSPIVRRAPVTAPSVAPAPRPDIQQAELVLAQPGTLPIVTDQFATVTVVSNEEARRSGAATLGDLLNNKPGIAGSSFAPGASSRPIIRGLDVNRVGIVENGIGANGASDLGEDHFVPIDPLATEQVEAIRGPATLRYGSQSIGGVVSASNNRIPDALPCAVAPPFRSYGAPEKATPLAGAAGPCVSFETRGAVSSVDNGLEGGVLLDAGGGNFAFHADAYGRKTDDYRVPSYPYANAPGLPFNGRQSNSSTRSTGGSVGGSYVFHGGFLGAAVSQTDSLYGIPGIEGLERNTRIDAKQTKIATKGEYRPDASAIDAIRFWGGFTDYRHNEIGLADPADLASDGVRQTFTNKEEEGRVEVQFAPFDVRFATLTTAIGAQAGHQRLTAPSPDDPGAQFNGLWDPNSNARVAGYIFNEFKFANTTKAQIAGRIEHVRLNGMTPDFPVDFVPDGVDRATVERNPRFTPKSASVGLIQNLPFDLVASVTAQYVERAPKPAELFSRGGHDATGTFDIGNPGLGIEKARTVEAGLRRAAGPFRFELTGYATRFDGFIYRNLTGLRCDEDFNSCGAPDGELNQAVYAQRNAVFRGAEFQFQYDVLPAFSGTFGLEGQYDIVRAAFTDGTNVPRIPPQRLGGGVYFRDASWFARINLLHAFAQNAIDANETTTSAYNRLRAEVSYRTKLRPVGFGVRELAVGVLGDNLLNEDIRNHVAFNKDQVLLPGRSVRLFANLKF